MKMYIYWASITFLRGSSRSFADFICSTSHELDTMDHINLLRVEARKYYNLSGNVTILNFKLLEEKTSPVDTSNVELRMQSL